MEREGRPAGGERAMDRTALADLWKFPWPVLDVLIGGQSSIDLPELRIATFEEATAFLRAYGFDPEERTHAKRLHAVLVEAIAFIERSLLLPREWNRGIRPPDEILAAEDPRHLLLWASGEDPRDRLKRAWACAVLRVMHTIGHIEGVNRTVDVQVARDQIFGRMRAVLHRDEARRLWLGTGASRVELSHVEWKEAKTRNSIILKLLHKRDNVAETIYDYLGVRIITKRVCDVMMVVKLLTQLHILVFPNAYPSRARNTLLDYKRFRAQIETLRDMLTAGSIAPAEFETMVARFTADAPVEGGGPKAHENPHSSQTYRAIQMTGRQLVRMRTPQCERLDRLRKAAKEDGMPPRMQRLLEEMAALMAGPSTEGGGVVESFFPFEVQIMDADSYTQVLAGDAAHDRYKLSQVRAARKRVLARVLELSRQSPA
jgi:uncharacterized protein (TIGR04562 family)